MIDDLPALATTLASGTSGSKRPKSVELRRAASTTYYALFHALTHLCADELVGATKPWAVYSPIYRSIEHTRSRQVLDQLRKVELDSAIAAVALTFAQLQEARHDADYNPEPFRFNRSGTIDLIEAGPSRRTPAHYVVRPEIDDCRSACRNQEAQRLTHSLQSL